MTEKDKELQELRREVAILRRDLEEANHIHQLDLSQIMYLRRQVDFLMEAKE